MNIWTRHRLWSFVSLSSWHHRTDDDDTDTVTEIGHPIDDWKEVKFVHIIPHYYKGWRAFLSDPEKKELKFALPAPFGGIPCRFGVKTRSNMQVIADKNPRKRLNAIYKSAICRPMFADYGKSSHADTGNRLPRRAEHLDRVYHGCQVLQM